MPYDNSQRAVAAASTRAQVLAAAHELFLGNGFAATTIRTVAESAGVSQETIYKSFGSKAALLKSVYDVALVGDADEVPLAARPEALRRPRGDHAGRLRHGVRRARGEHRRTHGPVAARAAPLAGQ